MNELKLTSDRKILPVASVVTFLGFLDTHLLIPIIALYASGLGASIGMVGIIVGLYSIINAPANILFGRLIDRVGHKVPLFVGLLGDALFMFLYSLCRLPVHLLLVRAFHGLSGSVVGPATMSVTADYSGRGGKGRAMSFYGMALGAAILVGYGGSGLIAARLGYNVVFWLGAALLVAGAALSLLLPGGKRRDRAATSYREVLIQVKNLFRRKGLALSYCSIFAHYFAFGGVVTVLPIYISELGMQAFHVGMLLAIFVIVFMIVQIPSGILSDRTGRFRPAVAGLSLNVVSLIILPRVTTFPLLAGVMAMYGVAYGLLFPSVSALVVDSTTFQERGVATGVFHALLTAGVAIGAPVIGWAGGALGIELGLTLSAVVMVLALFVALMFARRPA